MPHRRSITVAPAYPTTTITGPTRLTASGTYVGGGTQDLTSEVTWSVAGGSGLARGASGLCTCPSRAPGFFTATVTRGGVRGSARDIRPVG